ncbi:MAG: aromatic-ring-hydroxylating dioxygenase subunit beta [Jatrophihabitantaceae bacterium]
MLTFEDKCRIEELLRREAYLLDDRKFREWLELFTDDAEYLIPLNEALQGDVPPAGHPIVRDSKEMLLARVLKDETGFSHAETPVSMTCHLITNVVVDESPKEDAEVRSAFLVRQGRKIRDEAWWVGHRTDLVRRVEGEWRIAHRVINLDTTLLPRGISIFF